MGTLYRHFPTKDDLLVTVREQQFASWLTAAHERAVATEDPWADDAVSCASPSTASAAATPTPATPTDTPDNA